MKKLWLVAVAGLALSTSVAFAADLGQPQPYYKAPPPPPPPSWTGFYLDVDGGWGFNRRTGALSCDVSESECPDAPTPSIVRPSGGLAGGGIGYNWETGIVVYGIEADIQWADIKDSASTFTGPDLADIYSASDKLDWFGTVRGRLGLTPWGNTALIYVTGGLIYGQEKIAATLDNSEGIFADSASSTRTGGTVGVGLEYMFTPALSGKVEGLFYDMGSKDLPLTATESAHFHFTGAIVRAGLNWHFNVGGGGGPFPGQY